VDFCPVAELRGGAGRRVPKIVGEARAYARFHHRRRAAKLAGLAFADRQPPCPDVLVTALQIDVRPPSPGEWLRLPARWWGEVRAVRAAWDDEADAVRHERGDRSGGWGAVGRVG
jgi:hypothetical protein